jgi:WD40 repeat protein
MTMFASGDIEGNVKIYSLSTDRPLVSWSPHTSGILSLEFVRIKNDASDLLCASDCPEDPLFLITHGRDNEATFWRLDLSGDSDPTPLYSLPVNSLNFCKLSLSICLYLQLNNTPDESKHIIIAVPNTIDPSFIDIYNITTKTILNREIGRDSTVEKTGLAMCIKLLPNHRLIVGYESGEIKCFNIAFSPKLVQAFRHFTQPVFCIDSIGGDRFVAGSAEDFLVRFDVSSEDGAVVRGELEGDDVKGVSAVKFRSDGKIIVCGCWDSRFYSSNSLTSSIRVLSAKTMKPLAILDCHRMGIESLALGRDYILAGGKDAKISLWRIYPMDEIPVLEL